MSNISFSALVKLPGAAYHDFNRAMEGVAEIDSISREGDDYNANIDLALTELLPCIKIVQELSGSVLELIQNKGYDVVPKAIKKYVKAPGKTKKEEMIILLGKWHTSKEIESATGWTASVVGARLTGLRHAKRLQQKVGPDGLNLYRVKKIAA